MSEFIVHSVPGSPFGRSAVATLVEKGAPYKFSPVAPGELKGEQHLSRHAFGRVPVLEHDGFVLYETQAILRYIDRVLPSPALTPRDPRAAARMDQVMNISDWYLFQGAGSVIVFQRIVGPMFLGLTPDEGLIAAAMPKTQRAFKELSRLLGRNSYMAGDAVSLADFQVAPHLDMFAATPEWEMLAADAPALVAWLARMNERPSFRATTFEQLSALADAA